MRRVKPLRGVLGALGALIAATLLGGCATPQSHDYSALRAHKPRSILVLPPLNESTDVGGGYSFLSTVTTPIAELGYYVYPVAVVDQYLKENGLPTAGEMHQVPLAKLRDIIGADAVLYLDLLQYGSKFHLISSDTIVSVKARLVDARSGDVLWEGAATAQQGSNDNNAGGPLGALLAAALAQVINAKTDQGHNVSFLASQQLFMAPGRGLLYGPYNPKYGTD
jgi:hypothetical protein